MTARRPGFAVIVGLALCACAAVPATPPPDPVDYSKLALGDPTPTRLDDLGVTLAIPAAFEAAGANRWAVRDGGNVVALLQVAATLVPESGVDALLDRQLEALRRSGVAGVSRDERIELGDLDGRAIEAIDRLGGAANGLLLVAVEGETHLVVASILAPLALLAHHRPALWRCLASLRVALPPPGAAPPRADTGKETTP